MPVRRQWIGPQGAVFAANTTASYRIGGVLPGMGRVRVLGVYVFCNGVPSDIDGTMLLNVQVRDVTEGAYDDLVTSQDLETLVTASDTVFACTLTPETVEKEFSLEEKDTIRITLVNNSAAIDVNPATIIIVDLLYLDE